VVVPGARGEELSLEGDLVGADQRGDDAVARMRSIDREKSLVPSGTSW
jgi:hypothetical protein